MSNTLIFSLLFLLGSCLISGVTSSIQRMGKARSETLAKKQKGLAKFFFQAKKRDQLAYALNMTRPILLIGYTACGLSYLFPKEFSLTGAILILLGVAVAADSLFRIISLFRSESFFKATCQLTSLFLLPFWPICLLLFLCMKGAMPDTQVATSYRIKDKILEILHDAEFAPYLDPNDQKLILSLVSFKERIVREVMVPRIDMFTLSSTTSIREAAKGFLEEGYSRIPVWKETVDNIIGTLYYKDLFNIFSTHFTSDKELDAPIENLLKPIVYAPETKPISQLLQEFRNKQIHLAIVVDEYGGTEGIVTIEDILEELVGEIADEYDEDEEALFSVIPSGGWIVDSKMTILDIEEELGLQIPQGPEYETVGGYIFHKAGTIPSKGWRLHTDEFELEVLSSSERTIEKIRVTPN